MDDNAKIFTGFEEDCNKKDLKFINLEKVENQLRKGTGKVYDDTNDSRRYYENFRCRCDRECC